MQKNPRFKRKWHRDNRPASELLAPLQAARLLGVLDGSAVWLTPGPDAAQLLDRNVIGLIDGGPATAAHVRDALRQAFPKEQRQAEEAVAAAAAAAAAAAEAEEAPEAAAVGAEATVERGALAPGGGEAVSQGGQTAGVEGDGEAPLADAEAQQRRQQQQQELRPLSEETGVMPAAEGSVCADEVGMEGQPLNADPTPVDTAADIAAASAQGQGGSLQQGQQQQQQQGQGQQHGTGGGGGRSRGGRGRGRGGRGGGRGRGSGGWQQRDQDPCIKLSLEEAFFMVHALNCLQVAWRPAPGTAAATGATAPRPPPRQQRRRQLDGNMQQQEKEQEAAVAVGAMAVEGEEAVRTGAMGVEDEGCGRWMPLGGGAAGLWSRCCELRPDGFARLYAAFHHYRAKGYYPRSGIQYGSHYVLYQRHPAVCHSDFCVLVIPDDVGKDVSDDVSACPGDAEANGGKDVGDDVSACPSDVEANGGGGGASRRIKWMEMQIANRLCAQVGKRLVLLYLRAQPKADFSHPACLDSITAEEVLLSRWVPQSQQHQESMV